MSTFTILVIIFIVAPIVKKLLKHIKEQKLQSSGFSREDHSSGLRSMLNAYDSFRDEDFIDSAVGAYLFSYNDDSREFIFIQENGPEAVHHIKYQQLVSCDIRNTRDYGIFLDFKTTVPDEIYVSIRCFNREIALAKMPYLSSNLVELDNLYRLEQEKAEEIGEILQDILDENGNAKLPPSCKEEILANTTPPPVIPLPVEDEIEITDVEEEPAPIEMKEYIPDFEEPIPERGELPGEGMPGEFMPDTPSELGKQPEILIRKEETTLLQPETNDGKIQVSLSDIEEYSRGKFLDWEVQSAVGDAKVKGRKFIYMNPEQFEQLKS
jgi:hypothetical protein